MSGTVQNNTDLKLVCFHCGEDCPDESIHIDDKIFCCNGCKTVYEILHNNQMCDYYAIGEKPGISQKDKITRNFDFLDDDDVKSKFIEFSDGRLSTATFTIPQMHCSSCIWILENLYKMNTGISRSQLNYLQKRLTVTFFNDKASLKDVVLLLDSLGYTPDLNLAERESSLAKEENKKLYYRIGIAGFCFGNIMLLSFPEYLSSTFRDNSDIVRMFSWLNLILALPVFFYSANEYFSSAFKGLRKKIVNIDVPIALGIIVLFLRSFIEIVSGTGPGYFDSMAGLVFFLLVGKLFQNKTYEALNFERNYKSYFPIAVTITDNGRETTIPVEKLETGKRIFIRNGELIPADSILIKGSANIDYSFVTGESIPVRKNTGDMIYAGGKQVGEIIELDTIKEVSQSYLTQLWNNKAFQKGKDSRIVTLSNSVSKYFTFIVLALAIAGAAVWITRDVTKAFNVLTAVLIVACPCALALSTPFTLGNILRIFGRNKFYIKNTHVIEELASVNSIVFDKTGTITEVGSAEVEFQGGTLTAEEKSLIKTVVRNSSHPLSQIIYNSIDAPVFKEIDLFEEEPGSGINAILEAGNVKIGSSKFVGSADQIEGSNISTRVYVSINSKVKGYYRISNKYRAGLEELIAGLENNYDTSLLSGDSSAEKENLLKYFGNENELHFQQTPFDKLNYIRSLQSNGKHVLMLGDGLNDAGALQQSDVGISITENVNNFSPACDGILESISFNKLKDFILFSKSGKRIILLSFVLSFIYNAVGLGFALSGSLSPLVAAVLMPLSSISVVVFTTFSTNIIAKKTGLI